MLLLKKIRNPNIDKIKVDRQTGTQTLLMQPGILDLVPHVLGLVVNPLLMQSGIPDLVPHARVSSVV